MNGLRIINQDGGGAGGVGTILRGIQMGCYDWVQAGAISTRAPFSITLTDDGQYSSTVAFNVKKQGAATNASAAAFTLQSTTTGGNTFTQTVFADNNAALPSITTSSQPYTGFYGVNGGLGITIWGVARGLLTYPQGLQWSDGFCLMPTRISSATYTVQTNDNTILADATANAITITLSAASDSDGRRLTIVKTDGSGHAVTVSRAGGDTISGSTSVSLASQWSTVTLLSASTENAWVKSSHE